MVSKTFKIIKGKPCAAVIFIYLLRGGDLEPHDRPIAGDERLFCSLGVLLPHFSEKNISMLKREIPSSFQLVSQHAAPKELRFLGKLQAFPPIAMVDCELPRFKPSRDTVPAKIFAKKIQLTRLALEGNHFSVQDALELPPIRFGQLNRVVQSPGNHFLALPEELQWMILHYLSPYQLVGFQSVSQQCLMITGNKLCWAPVLAREIPTAINWPDNSNWSAGLKAHYFLKREFLTAFTQGQRFREFCNSGSPRAHTAGLVWALATPRTCFREIQAEANRRVGERSEWNQCIPNWLTADPLAHIPTPESCGDATCDFNFITGIPDHPLRILYARQGKEHLQHVLAHLEALSGQQVTWCASYTYEMGLLGVTQETETIARDWLKSVSRNEAITAFEQGMQDNPELTSAESD